MRDSKHGGFASGGIARCAKTNGQAADPLSRVDISNAIQLSQLQGIASTTWKLAEEFEGSKFSTVGIDELIEALYLSLSEKAKIVGASNETGY